MQADRTRRIKLALEVQGAFKIRFVRWRGRGRSADDCDDDDEESNEIGNVGRGSKIKGMRIWFADGQVIIILAVLEWVVPIVAVVILLLHWAFVDKSRRVRVAAQIRRVMAR